MSTSASQIPGMIDPAEQDLLVDVASSLQLDKDDVVCEFGCYLGRSTHAIANGLSLNRTAAGAHRSQPVFHAFDVFECGNAGVLAAYLLRDTQEAGIRSLLTMRDGRIDFRRAFDHFMDDVDPSMVRVHQTTLKAAQHPGGRIAMMHLDAPKWHVEYRQVLSEFGPHFKAGARVIFQDFFYHWSAELIAGVEFFIQRGLYEPLETAASSLLVRLKEPIGSEPLNALDQAIAEGRIEGLVESAIKRFSEFEVDRAPAFLPRLFLAALQSSHEGGKHERAADWLRRLERRFTKGLPSHVVADLADLLRYGFSMRSVYELDTVVKPIDRPSDTTTP